MTTKEKIVMKALGIVPEGSETISNLQGWHYPAIFRHTGNHWVFVRYMDSSDSGYHSPIDEVGDVWQKKLTQEFYDPTINGCDEEN